MIGMGEVYERYGWGICDVWVWYMRGMGGIYEWYGWGT